MFTRASCQFALLDQGIKESLNDGCTIWMLSVSALYRRSRQQRSVPSKRTVPEPAWANSARRGCSSADIPALRTDSRNQTLCTQNINLISTSQFQSQAETTAPTRSQILIKFKCQTLLQRRQSSPSSGRMGWVKGIMGTHEAGVCTTRLCSLCTHNFRVTRRVLLKFGWPVRQIWIRSSECSTHLAAEEGLSWQAITSKLNPSTSTFIMPA